MLTAILLAPHVFFLSADPMFSNQLLGKTYFKEGGVVYDTTNSLVKVESQELKNIEKLNKIVIALYKYENEHYSFPVSAEGGSQWSRQDKHGDEWIKGLVPDYIDELPKYNRRDSDSRARFIYHSRGTDFKLIAYEADDCQKVKASAQQLVDLRRPGCIAYGYWTEGAVTQ